MNGWHPVPVWICIWCALLCNLNSISGKADSMDSLCLDLSLLVTFNLHKLRLGIFPIAMQLNACRKV